MSLPVCKELVKISMENVNLNPSHSSYKYPESELGVNPKPWQMAEYFHTE
jgi:hypothetical protein